MKYVSRPKNATVKDIDIADIFLGNIDIVSILVKAISTHL